MSSESSKVGVIGLGLLGSAIADRLLGQRFTVVGFDTKAIQRDQLQTRGGMAVPSAGEVFQHCEFILLSLPTSQVVSSVLQQNAAPLRPGITIIDTTTGDPDQMIAIGESLAERGINYLEANVAGSSMQMRDGTATVFLGGSRQVIDPVEAILSVIAPRRQHLGPIGAASKFKLVHNLVLGLHRAVLAEGLCFAESLGFSPTETLAILQETPAASSVMATKGENMATRTFDVQARLSQHLKDVRLILDIAARAGARVHMSELHCRLLERAESLGFGEVDNSAIIEAYYADALLDPSDLS